MVRPLVAVSGCVLGRSVWLLPPWAKAGKARAVWEKMQSLQFSERQTMQKVPISQGVLHGRGKLKGQLNPWVRR